MKDSNGIISASELHKVYPSAGSELSVLNGIDLVIGRGETVAITGASGVGKSTLLHLLGGLDRPTKGTVAVSNVMLNNQSDADLARFRCEHLGFVFQHHYLMEDFSAMENVMIPQLMAGKSEATARKRSEQLLGEVGLHDRMTHRPGQLSGGEQQRVAVARALANEPSVLIADEPSGNLDTETGRQLHQLLFRLNREKNTTILVATHNRELAEGCQREVRLMAGTIAGNTPKPRNEG
jgi:predicted ABC-type transport system involved in lysophospholipase L1 biosynthesis ATPase subunit